MQFIFFISIKRLIFVKNYIMSTSDPFNYQQIAQTIEYLNQNPKSKPSMAEITKKIGLNLPDFQQILYKWTGTDTPSFLEYITPEYPKKLLLKEQASLFETVNCIDFQEFTTTHNSIKILQMTHDTSKKSVIFYQYTDTIFGRTLVASTDNGLCYLGFEDTPNKAFNDLQSRFPKFKFVQQNNEIQQNALTILLNKKSTSNTLQLHLKGTDFQLKVWKSLLQIPFGNLSTYGKIAQDINHQKASRAVGTAIGNNPISFLIPCHRVIQTSGNLGGYMWGLTRKIAMIGWEGLKTN